MFDTKERMTHKMAEYKVGEDLAEMLLRNRPNLKEQTIRTYVSILKSIYRLWKPEASKGDSVPYSFFEDYGLVMDLLKDKPPNSRRTYLSAIVVLLNDGTARNKYKEQMLADIGKYQEHVDSQEMSETQENNWISHADVMKKWEELRDEVAGMFKKGKKREEPNKRKLVNFMLLSLTGGIFFEPRRSKDWAFVKVKDVDKARDNWIDIKKNEFVFNNHKMQEKRGVEKIKFPKEFKKWLTAYIKMMDSEYLLVNTYGGAMTNTQITQYLNTIFGGKKISTSMLRHIYISDKNEGMPALKALKQEADNMGHSLQMHLEYIKKAPKAPSTKSPDSV